MTTLSTRPELIYLLREFYETYRRGSAGGSPAIRQHQRRVREELSRIMTADAPLADREPASKPVVSHLGRALDNGMSGPQSSMVRAVGRIADTLTWEYGYERLPRELARRFAYTEVLGPRGPVVADSLILGFVLFGPGCTYPQHAHEGIAESYISISGAWSENGAAVYAPGSLILNQPGQHHRITVDVREPCLLAYGWIGSRERLVAPGMRFSRSRR
ncbi:MAG: dimethylsulfonioproprionate lyase family protein [Ectothiorhodospiraceae bacterium]|jgi:dimethylpropiothetin dethiomethylase